MKRPAGPLYLWVLLAIFTGGLWGVLSPASAVKLKPLGDGFIALVKMLISPVIFCTIVLGIAGAGDMRKIGRVGAKALLYFELVSTLALAVGLVVTNLLKPGAGFNVDPATLDAKAVSGFAKAAVEQSTVDFLLHLIPKTFADAFTGSGDLLQVLLVSVLFGYAMTRLGERGKAVHTFIEEASHIFFAMMNVVMKFAPLGAGGQWPLPSANTAWPHSGRLPPSWGAFTSVASFLSSRCSALSRGLWDSTSSGSSRT